MDANPGVPFSMLDWQNSHPNASIGILSEILSSGSLSSQAHKRLVGVDIQGEDPWPNPRETPPPRERPPLGLRASLASSASGSTITCTSGCCLRSLRVP